MDLSDDIQSVIDTDNKLEPNAINAGAGITIDSGEFAALNGVQSNIQDQINTKQVDLSLTANKVTDNEFQQLQELKQIKQFKHKLMKNKKHSLLERFNNV